MKRTVRPLIVGIAVLALCSPSALGLGLYDWGARMALETSTLTGSGLTFDYIPTTSSIFGLSSNNIAITDTYPPYGLVRGVRAVGPAPWGSWVSAVSLSILPLGGPPPWPPTPRAALAAADTLWVSGPSVPAPPWWGWTGLRGPGTWWGWPGLLGPGMHSRVMVDTLGVGPSFAAAAAHAQESWIQRYFIPKSFWTRWVPFFGQAIPTTYQLGWGGWFDGPAQVQIEAWITDSEGNTHELLEDGFCDNGDGTFTQLGNTLDPADLVYNVNVGGTGQPGWDIVSDTPYQFVAMLPAVEIGRDQDYVELEVAHTFHLQLGQPIPEPTTLGLLGIGMLGIAYRWHRRPRRQAERV